MGPSPVREFSAMRAALRHPGAIGAFAEEIFIQGGDIDHWPTIG
ncbi:MAG TPA: hypothetical protein VIJ63_18975 [Roseiarcus sp.]